eukprot:Seg2229.2 transcript_id=Seg2229.2/GoldUCD/mRNA.D3Y31 product="Ribosome biogenesis protein NSA2" protein_id=Seg2229.2/GoldUCD/D3Y31
MAAEYFPTKSEPGGEHDSDHHQVESPTYNIEQFGGYSQQGSHNTLISNNLSNINIDKLIIACTDVWRPNHQAVADERIEKLPQDIKNFVGRLKVLDSIREQFENHKFVVLYGGPYHGKTAVSIKFAHQVKNDYGIILWVDMADIEAEAKDGNQLQNICTKILNELNVDTNNLEGNMVFYLERNLSIIDKKTILILDNIEDFIVFPTNKEHHYKPPLAKLFQMISKNAQHFVSVLGVSKFKPNETIFKDYGSVSLEPLSEEEGEQYLLSLLYAANQEYTSLLNKKCCGIPLVCGILAKMLNELHGRDKEYFLSKIECVPLVDMSPDMNHLLDIFLGSLSADENKAAEIVGVFPSSFSLEFAEKLCGELEKDSCLIECLIQKSVISKSNVDGYVIHPFLREFIQSKEDFKSELSIYKAALIKVYLKYFMKLSDESFEKDKSRKCKDDLHQLMSAFNHLVVLVASSEMFLNHEQLEEIRSKVFNEDSPWLFILLLLFLYHLVSQKDIEAIFKFLHAIAREEDKGIVQACLNELKWVDDIDVSLITDDYEYVMAERRKLSNMVKDHDREPRDGLEERLIKLSDKILRLQNHKVCSYYLLKTEELLGEMFEKSDNQEKALAHYEKSLEISKGAFGDSSMTIDCCERVAADLCALGDADNAMTKFTEAYNMATRTRLQDLGKITNLLLSMGSFLIKRPDEDSKEEGKTLLLKSVNISKVAGDNKGMCQALQMVQEYFRTVGEPDKTYIDLMDGRFSECKNVASQSIDKEEVTRETKKGIEILKEAIQIVSPRLELSHRFKDEYVQALFSWNREIAGRCAHVMLESERKPFAKEALRLAETYALKKYANDISVLRRVESANRSVEEEKQIMHVTFLENITDTMIEKKQGNKLQHDLLKAKEQCQESWLHIKIIKCLMQIPAIEQNERLKYVEETIKLLSDQNVRTQKPFLILRKHIPTLLKEATEKKDNDSIKRLYEYCITVIETLEAKRMEDEKQGDCCKHFEFEFYVVLLENYQWSDEENEKRLYFTKKALQVGKERKLFKKRYSGLDKEYEKFIDSKESHFLMACVKPPNKLQKTIDEFGYEGLIKSTINFQKNSTQKMSVDFFKKFQNVGEVNILWEKSEMVCIKIVEGTTQDCLTQKQRVSLKKDGRPCSKLKLRTKIPQNEHIEQSIKRHGRRLDYHERLRKKQGREPHDRSLKAKKLHGLKAKLYNKKRHAEKIQMKKTMKMHQEKKTKAKDTEKVPDGAVPAYLLDREGQTRAKVLSNMIKQKRKEKAGKWDVPLPKVRAVGEDEVFKVVRTGKTRRKCWKRMVTKVTYVGEDFTRKPPKYERFIRPMALRFKKAHVTHPELKATFCLSVIGVKKNPQSPMYTSLGVITKGTVIEVNVSELGLVTQGGKVVWGKYAQVTNNPENDGCINAVLLV